MFELLLLYNAITCKEADTRLNVFVDVVDVQQEEYSSRTKPSGTPDVTSVMADTVPLFETRCLRYLYIYIQVSYTCIVCMLYDVLIYVHTVKHARVRTFVHFMSMSWGGCWFCKLCRRVRIREVAIVHIIYWDHRHCGKNNP